MPSDYQPIASHFVDGRYLEDEAGAEIEVIYPATGDAIARVHSATASILEQAITAAEIAQKTWAAMTGIERGRVLMRAAQIMRERNRDAFGA